MGTITKTFTETYARPTDAASTWTVVFEQLSDVVVSASTFKLVYPASAKAKYSAYSGKAYASIGGILTISSIDDALTITAEYRHAGTWAGNTYENLARSGAKYTTYKTSDFFNTTNPTERTIPLYLTIIATIASIGLMVGSVFIYPNELTMLRRLVLAAGWILMIVPYSFLREKKMVFLFSFHLMYSLKSQKTMKHEINSKKFETFCICYYQYQYAQ